MLLRRAALSGVGHRAAGGVGTRAVWSISSLLGDPMKDSLAPTPGAPVARVLTMPSYVQDYCNGGAAYRYTGANTATAFNFISGSGGAVHATLCSTGLGM